MPQISFSVTFDELRVDSKRHMEFHALYAGWPANDDLITALMVNHIGARMNEVECRFYYSALPPLFCCEHHLKEAMVTLLKRIAAPIAATIQ